MDEQWFTVDNLPYVSWNSYLFLMNRTGEFVIHCPTPDDPEYIFDIDILRVELYGSKLIPISIELLEDMDISSKNVFVGTNEFLMFDIHVKIVGYFHLDNIVYGIVNESSSEAYSLWFFTIRILQWLEIWIPIVYSIIKEFNKVIAFVKKKIEKFANLK